MKGVMCFIVLTTAPLRAQDATAGFGTGTWSAQPAFFLAESQSGLKRLAISPDGRFLASTVSGAVNVFDLESRKLLYTLDMVSSSAVFSLAFSWDGTRLAGGANGLIKIWGLNDGRILRSIWTKVGAHNALAFSPDGAVVAAGNYDQTIRLYNASDGLEIKVLKGHSSPVEAVEFSLDGQRLVSCSGDLSIKIWNVATGTEERVFSGHLNRIQNAQWSADGERIFSSAEDKSARWWSTANGEEISTWPGVPSAGVLLSPDEKFIIAKKPRAVVLIGPTGETVLELTTDKLNAAVLAVSPDGRWIAAASHSGSGVFVWPIQGLSPSKKYGRYVKVGVTLADKTPPSIVVFEPKSRESVVPENQKTAILKGRITDEGGVYEVTVNGRDVDVSKTGDFAAEENLAFGDNVFRIRAVDKSGNVSETTLTVRRQTASLQTATTAGRSGKDYALIFAIGEYAEWPALVNPVPDANAIAGELRSRYGFETDVVVNPTLPKILTRLRDYAGRTFGPDDQLFILFAGHGQFDDIFNEGYLVAKDSKLNDDVKTSYLSHSNLRTVINNIPNNHIFLAIDACFGGTFDPKIASRGDDGGMSRQDFIALKMRYKTRRYVTSGGKEYVPDGTPGRHSPFAARLIEALRSNGGDDGILTLSELAGFIEKVSPQPRMGEFGVNEPGSDFLFIKK